MKLFSHLHKSAFWSQLVLGMVAIFALPQLQAITQNEARAEINQSFHQSQQQTLRLQVRQPASIFTLEQPPALAPSVSRWGKIPEFFTRPQTATPPPIRAGPFPLFD